MIVRTNPDTVAINTSYEKKKLRLEIKLSIQRLLRKKFDAALTDYEAQAAIEIAKEYKFSTAEMEVDYALELEGYTQEEREVA